MKNYLFALAMIPAFSVALVAPTPTPSPVPTETPVQRDLASGIGHVTTPVTGEMAKDPENRKGAKEIPCTRENGFFFHEPGMKCIGFN